MWISGFVVHTPLAPTRSERANADLPGESARSPSDTAHSTLSATQTSTPNSVESEALSDAPREAGSTDLDQAVGEMLDRLRGEPWFGEWSMRYLVIADALKADLDRDRNLTTADAALLMGWIDGNDVRGDFNEDGAINAEDLNDFHASAARRDLIEINRADGSPWPPRRKESRASANVRAAGS